jgi:MFS family permease
MTQTGKLKIATTALYTPSVLLLAFVVGISYLGLGLIMPLRALYGREIGASSVDIGLMASSFSLAGFFATPLLGWVTDRISYRSTLAIGLLLHMVLTLGYIPIQNPYLLIALRACEGIAAAAVLPPVRALMNTIAPPSRQGEVLGVVSAAQTVGILIGPAVGSLLAARFGYTLSFLIAGIPLGVMAGFTMLMLPPIRSARKQEEALSRPQNSLLKTLFTRPLVLSYALQMLLMIATGVGASVWTLYMADRGSSLLLIGLSFTTFALPIIFLAPLAGRLSDRLGRYPLLLLGLLLTGLTFCLYSLPLSPLWIVGISMLEGASVAIVRAPVDGLLADVMPAEMRGKVQANYNAAGTIGNFVGATGAGILYLLSPGAPFIAEGTLYLVMMLVLLLPSMARMFPKRGDAEHK